MGTRLTIKNKLRVIMKHHNVNETSMENILAGLSDDDAKIIYIMIQKIAIKSALKEMIKGSL
tara:strand:- start:423 stop:608 length:186 start_codon:yes stop_codon:yes gene_type:complete